MKNYLILAMVLALFLAGCGSAPADSADGKMMDSTAADTMEKKVAADAVVDETMSGSTTYCEPGRYYNYGDGANSVQATIIGEETYKGKTMCKATAKTTIESPVGPITNDIVYYYTAEGKEVYVTTTTSGAMMPTPQVNEMHMVDGKVVSS